MKRETSIASRIGFFDMAATPLVALELMTVLRLRRPPIVGDAVLGSSQAWFPLVGLLVGGAAYGVDSGALRLFSPGVSGWLTAAFVVVLTGALHLDGLADSVDGVFGGHSPAQRLSIMRESAIGVFGMCAIAVLLGVKAAAIGSLDAGLRLESLLLAPCLARWASVVTIAAFPYARPSGLGQSFHAQSYPWAAPVAAATATAAAFILAGWAGLGIFAGAGVLGFAAGAFIASRVGGVTGDSYGAVIEITEVAVLLVFVAIGAR